MESAVHKKRKEFALSMDSKAVQHSDFVPPVAFPVRSRLAFKANDSSYVFKILIGKVVAKRPVSSENKQGSPSDVVGT